MSHSGAVEGPQHPPAWLLVISHFTFLLGSKIDLLLIVLDDCEDFLGQDSLALPAVCFNR